MSFDLGGFCNVVHVQICVIMINYFYNWIALTSMITSARTQYKYIVKSNFCFQNLGLPLSMTVKVQVNMVLGDLKYNAVAKPFSGLYLPIVWMEAVSTLIFFLLGNL